MRRHDVAERGSKIAQIRRSGIRGTYALQRFRNRRRVMREIVVDRDTGGRPAMLQPPADAFEARSPSAIVSVLGQRRHQPRAQPARCERCRRPAAAPRMFRSVSRSRRTPNVVDVAVS